MKQLVYSICLLLITLIKASAQKKAASANINNNSLLWEISGNGLKVSSYLFGTYYFAGKVFVDSLPYIDRKFKSCKAVVGEVVMDSTVYAKIMPLMMADKPLDQLFTPDEYQQIADSAVRVAHTDISNYNTMKPAALSIILMSMLAPKTMGEEENPPLDIYFQYAAKKMNERVIGLETAEFQAGLLLNGDMADQKRHLLSFISKISRQKQTGNKLYQLYCKQDLAGLASLMNADDDFSKKEMDAMLKNRNMKWLAKLPAIMIAQPTFIAVGAGHLLGQYGLIEQLRLKGYTIRAVKI